MTVGARELKTRLGTYLRRVEGGASIVVTERGRPVARISPLGREDAGEEERLEELAAQGLITRGSGRPLPPFRPVRCLGRPVSEALLEDREDRF